MPNKSLLKRAKTDNYTSKPMKLGTQWLKNATRSLGGNALETLESIAPNIYSVAETSARLAKQVTKSGNADTIGQKISSNRYVAMGRTSIKNALKDLKSGNFDGSGRSDGDSGDESTSYNFGDNGEDEGTDASQKPIFVNMEGLDTVNASINKQTQYQMRAAQAGVDTMIATSSAMMAANQKNAEASINLLTNINNSLQSLVRYQNENMTKFIQASMTYYETMGKKNSEEENTRDVNASDVFEKDGKFNVGKYGEFIRGNVTKALQQSDIGFLATALDSAKEEIMNNPMKIVSKALIDKLIPAAIKSTTEAVDKTFGNFIGEYIMKQSESLKGKNNFFAKFFGDALDLNISRKDSFELGGRVNTDAAVFDGISRNALTSEIPMYLRESTAYLRKLVELNGGDPDRAVAKSNIYNRETGNFEKYENYSKNLLDSINQTVIKSFQESDFGKSLSKVANANELGDRQEEFTKVLDQFYLALEKDKRQRIDITKRGEDSDIAKIIQGLSGNDDMKQLLESAVYSSFDNKKGGMNINISRLAAKNARNEQIGNLEKNYTLAVAEALKGETDIDTAATKARTVAAHQEKSATPLTYLQHIEELLQRGINVRVTGKNAYRGMTFRSSGDVASSGETSETSSSGASQSTTPSPVNGLNLNDIMSRGEETPEAKGKVSKLFANGGEKLRDAMHALVKGDKEAFSTNMRGLVGDGASDLWDKIKNSDAAQSVGGLLKGEKDKDGKVVKEGLIDKVKNKFTEGMDYITKEMFGEKGDIEKLKKEAMEKAKEAAPAALKGAAFGIGAGGILGSLVGGPLTGAVLGTAGHFISNSETFQKVLYGELTGEVDENGKPIRDFTGIIDKRTTEFMKKNKGLLTAGGVGGAAIGAMTGGGILGSLVGGPIAGAFLGTAATAIAKSDTFQKFVFGEPDPNDPTGEKKIGGIMGMFRNAFGGLDKDRSAVAQLGGGAAAGAGLGLLASFFTPIGPIGGAAVGLGASMIASKDKFKEMLFGKKDKDGNKISKGLVETLGNRMHKEVIAPLAGIAGEALMSAKDAVMDHILDPIMNLAEPIIGLTSMIYDKVTDKLDKLVDTVGGGVKKIVGKGFGLVGKGIGFLFKKVFGDKENGILGGAMKIGGSIGNFVGDKIRKKTEKASRKKFFSDRYQNSKAGQAAMQDAREAWENLSEEDQAKYKGFPDFLDKFARKKFYNAGDGREARLEARNKRKADRTERKAKNKEKLLRESMISKLTGGDYGEDTDEARQAALNKLKNSRAYRGGRTKYKGFDIDELEKMLTPKGSDAKQAILNDKEELEEAKKHTTLLQSGFVSVTDALSTGFGSVVHALGTVVSAPGKAVGAGLNAIGNKMEASYENKVQKASIASKAAQSSNNKDIDREAEIGSMEYRAGVDLDKKTFGFFSRHLDTNMKKVLKDKRVSEDSELYNAAKTALDENASMVDRYKAMKAFPGLYKQMKKDSWEAARAVSGHRKGLVKNKFRKVKGSISEMLNKTGGRGYASGTIDADEGTAVVGENGPEIVTFKGGEKVIPNNKAIDVNIIGVSKGALQGELEDATVDVNLTGQDGPITTYGTQAKLDENTDNKSTIEKALAKKDALVDYNDIKADNGDDNDKEEKKEKSSFLSMLGGIGSGIVDIVKGIVPMAGAIGGLYLLFKNPNGVMELLGNIGSGIKGIVEFFTGKGSGSEKDATTTGVNAVTSVADVQVDSLWDYANPLGKLNHNTRDAAGNNITNTAMTEAKNEVLYKQALRNQFLGTGTINQSLNTFKSNRALNSAVRWDKAANFADEHLGGIGSGTLRNRSDKKLAQAEKYEEKANAAQNRNAGASVLRTAGKVGTMYALSSGAGWATEKVAENLGMSEEGAEVLGNVATIATSGGLSVNMAKSAAKGKDSIVDKIVDGVGKLLSKFGEKLANTKAFKKVAASNVGQIFSKFSKKVTSAIKDNFTDKFQKIATMKLADLGISNTAAIASLGVTTIIGGVTGLISGACGTEHLFGVLPGDADAGMVTVSSIMGTVFGALETLPGIGWVCALIDVIDAILIAIPPISLELGSFKLTIGGVGLKQALARFIYSALGGKENLDEKHQAFQDEKNYYAETYGVEMNDATFNDMVNNTGALDTLWHGKVKRDENGHLDYDDAGKVLYRGGVKGLFVGAENEYAKDENGNVIKDSTGKAVVAKDAYGNTIKKDAKWGDSVGRGFHNFGRWLGGGDIYETDENGQAVVDENGNYVVKDKEKNIFGKAADWLGFSKEKEVRKVENSGVTLQKPGEGKLLKSTDAKSASSIAGGLSGAFSGILDTAKKLSEKTNETGEAVIEKANEKFDATLSETDTAHQSVLENGKKLLGTIAENGFGKIVKSVMNVGKGISDTVKEDGEGLVKSLGDNLKETTEQSEKLTGTISKSGIDILSVFNEQMKTNIKSILGVNTTDENSSNMWTKLRQGLSKKFGIKNWNTSIDTEGQIVLAGGKGGTPFYSQKDPRWANMEYEEGGSGVNKETMADAGCGPAAFAMAASGATGQKIDPVESAAVMQNIGARDETGTNWRGIGKAADAYGIDTKMSMKPSESFIDNELDAGKPVVLSGRSGGYGETPYTSQGHYVVATGKDNKGNYIINDPNSRSGPRKFNKSEIVKETGAAWGFGGRGPQNQFTQTLMNDTGSSGSSTDEKKKNEAYEKWINIIVAVKKAIADQHPGYSQSNWINITVGGKTLKVRTDCSGFVGACLKYMGLISDSQNMTSRTFANQSDNVMLKTGFKSSGWIGWDQLEPGDIIAKDGHVEIFAKNENGKHYVWNCGGDSSVNSPNPTVTGHSGGYSTVWSPTGANADKAVVNCDVTASDGTVISTSSSSSATASSGGFLSKLTSFFTELGSRAVEGITTGKWNTDWKGFFSGNSSSDSGDYSTGSSVNNSFGGDVAATTISADESKEKNWKFLTQKMGFTKEAAAGVMGCWQAESSNKPNTIEGYYLKNYPGDSAVLKDNASLNEYTEKVLFPAYAKSGIGINKSGYKGTDGNYYPGFGLAQWTGPRGQQLFEFAKGRGLDWRTSEGQLAYVESELNGSKSKFRDAIKNVDNVKDATILALDKYEMTEGAHNNAKHWNPRYSYAQGIYETFKDRDFGGETTSSGGGSSRNTGLNSPSNRNVALAAYGGKGTGKKFGGRGLTTSDNTSMYSSMTSGSDMNVLPSGKQNTADFTSVVKYLNSILNVLTQSNSKLDMLKALQSIGDGFGGTIQQNVFTSSKDGSQPQQPTTKNVIALEKTSSTKFDTARKIASGGL